MEIISVKMAVNEGGRSLTFIYGNKRELRNEASFLFAQKEERKN